MLLVYMSQSIRLVQMNNNKYKIYSHKFTICLVAHDVCSMTCKQGLWIDAKVYTRFDGHVTLFTLE